MSRNRRMIMNCRKAAPRLTANTPVSDAADLDPTSVDLIFCAVESEAAKVLETGFAVAIDGELMEDALLQRIDDAKEIVLVPKMEGG